MGGTDAPGHLHSDHVAGLHCSCFAEYVRPVQRLLGHFLTKTFSEGHGLTPFVSLPPKAGDDAIEDVAASGLLPRKPRISGRFVARFTSALCTGLGSPGPSAFLNEGLAPRPAGPLTEPWAAVRARSSSPHVPFCPLWVCNWVQATGSPSGLPENPPVLGAPQVWLPWSSLQPCARAPSPLSLSSGRGQLGPWECSCTPRCCSSVMHGDLRHPQVPTPEPASYPQLLV